ncbi:MAG: hypothetical protein ACRD3Q_08360 [Terriglobales bacterium]
MQKHLDEGCADCKKTQALWDSVQNFAHREMTYEPPANALRIAESYLAPFKLASGRSQTLRLATPTFDSFAGQALAGLRGSGLAPQQLMYKCGNVFIDLRLEPKPATRSIALAGQIVSSEKPAGGVEGIPVSLLAKKETWLETTTNQLGEFHFSFPPGQHLELLFGTKGASVLVVLPDAEGLG